MSGTPESHGFVDPSSQDDAVPLSSLDRFRTQLEDLAIATMMSIMGSGSMPPDIRLQAARDALKALGKDQPPKTGPNQNQLILNFGTHLPQALGGVEKILSLMDSREPKGTTRE